MGILFGGWAREEEEERQWYIKKYGKKAGQLAYDQYKKEYEIQAEINRNTPHVYKWSKTEPKVTIKDVIASWVKDKEGIMFHLENEAVIVDITDEGELMVRYISNVINDGQVVKWDKGEYRKVCSVAEYDTEGLQK